MSGCFHKKNSTGLPKGFTLIELLVVIAILALLLAILFPALRSAKAIAKRLACGANLKQIAVAWDMYLSDNSEKFYQGNVPFCAGPCDHSHSNNPFFEYGGWNGLRYQTTPEADIPSRPLNKYLDLPGKIFTQDQAEVYRCPADRGGAWGSPYPLHEKFYNIYGISYFANLFVIGHNVVTIYNEKVKALFTEVNSRLDGLRRNHIDNPSRIVLIGDQGWYYQWDPQVHPSEPWKTQMEWHQREEMYNMAFLDGHVEFLKIIEGYFVTAEYCLLPWRDLRSMAMKVQECEPEEPPE